MADQNMQDLEAQVKRLKEQLELLTRSSDDLMKSQQSLGRMFENDLQKRLGDGATKMFKDAGRKAEEEAVRQARVASQAAKQRDLTKDEADSVRLGARVKHDKITQNKALAASNALGELGTIAVKLGGQLYKGMDGLSGFAEATDSAVSTVAKFASAIGGPVTLAISALAVGLSKYATAAVAQSDKLYKAHKDLSQSGAAASDGIQGVYDMMQQFSLGADELNKMTGLIAANSQSLAMFKGNVASGARALGKISGEIKDSGLREQFLSMGISMEDQRESAAAYISLQTRIGGVQNKSTKEIAASIGEYVKETDAITKITGATRKEQEAARNRAMAIEQFRFKQEQAAASGTDAEKKIAKTQLETFNMLSSLGAGGKQVAEGVAAMASGFISEGPGLELSKLIGTKGSEIMNDAALTAAQKTELIMKEVDTALKGAGGGLAASGNFGKVFQGLDYGALQDSLKVSGQFGKRLQEATTEQQRQTIMNEAATAAQVKGEVANLDSRAALQGFVQMGVLPATEAMSAFARGVAAVTSILPQTAVGKPADARTTIQRTITQRNDPRYTGPGEGINPMGTAPGTPTAAGTAPGTLVAGTAPQTAAEKQAAKNYASQLTVPPGTNAAPAGATTGSIDSGPVFGNRTQVTLVEIRDEIKKLVKMGAIPGGAASGQAQAQAALAEHDHAHPHEPAGAASPELAAKIGSLVAPLEKMSVTSGMMRNDGKTYHGAVDLAGKIGDKVMAPISGMAKVLSDPKGYGNYVEVTDTITGVKHILAHLDQTMIKTGDVVKAGQQVGTVGNTGKSTGAHLHHEIKLPDGTRVDPRQFYAGGAGRSTAPVAGRTPGGAPGGATDMTTYMRTVAMLESGGDPRAKNARSSAGGLFQFLESSYEGVTGRKGSGAERYDPTKSTEAMAKFSAQQKGQMEKNLGRGVSGADLYMGHFLGASGATKFLGAKDRDPTQSAAKFDPAAAKANPELYYDKQGKERNLEELYQLMTEKYRKQEANVMTGNIPALVAGITGTGTLASGGMAGPSTVPTPVAAAPGTTAALPAAAAAAAEPQPAQPSTVAQQNSLMLQQLVTLNQQQNGLLGRILQTSQA
jgi:murein DD-endopeptidase MepM/ murein hydrolase activator NlpD